MQEKHLFEYAVIRVVPRVEREEFMNVGVIVYCQSQRFLSVKYHLPAERLQCFSSDLDIEEIEKNLHAFEQISKGGRESGPIGQQPIVSRFRWLTATRSTVLQTSPVHLGLCDDLDGKIESLFKNLVS